MVVTAGFDETGSAVLDRTTAVARNTVPSAGPKASAARTSTFVRRRLRVGPQRGVPDRNAVEIVFLKSPAPSAGTIKLELLIFEHHPPKRIFPVIYGTKSGEPERT